VGPASTNIIIYNDRDEILLHLRDNKPTILYPNTWALPGGYIEEGETPEQCILREMTEELGIEFKEVSLFLAAQRSYGFEYTFCIRASFRVEEVRLTEGQAIKWFACDEIEQMKLGYEDNAILLDFFQQRPDVSMRFSV
jgi:8-oxo-dGTP diphosphatase